MTTPVQERPLVFPCAGESLIGILHSPGRTAPGATGVVIVVGGPQYRVGSHRMFVDLARALARAGHPVLRFDVRGMGDSTGEHPGFEHIGPDIGAAVDALAAAVPGLDGVALWGLCDGASAICAYAGADPRLRGVVLVNPWVREEASYDDALLRDYYARRLFQRDFWRRLLRLDVNWGDFPRLIARRLRRGARGSGVADGGGSLVARMGRGLQQSGAPALVILSDEDLTAREFARAAAADARWAALEREARLTRVALSDADHTLSDPDRMQAMIDATRQWLSE